MVEQLTGWQLALGAQCEVNISKNYMTNFAGVKTYIGLTLGKQKKMHWKTYVSVSSVQQHRINVGPKLLSAYKIFISLVDQIWANVSPKSKFVIKLAGFEFVYQQLMN